jgi:hypothetical protein
MTAKMCTVALVAGMDPLAANDAKSIQYGLVRRCLSKTSIYWQRAMPPSISSGVMRQTVDDTILECYARICDHPPLDLSAEEVARWRSEVELPTSMGGDDVAGAELRSDACFVAGVLGCLRRLRKDCSLLRGVDVMKSKAPLFVELRQAHARLLATHATVQATYATYDGNVVHRLDGHKQTQFHPERLPRQMRPLADLVDPSSEFTMPPQRMLIRIPQHDRWLACTGLNAQRDADDPHPVVRNFQASRWVSHSQPTAGGLLDTPPDGTFATSTPNRNFAMHTQLRHGLPLSATVTIAERASSAPAPIDRHGVALGNRADHNRRHNATMGCTRDMVQSTAIGSVLLGDKADPEKTADINSGTVVDVVELAGDEDTGADVCHEVKVPSATTAGRKMGRGSSKTGSGTPVSDGHLFAHGNTDEEYRLKIVGCRKRGLRRHGPFKHATGKGYVAKDGGLKHPPAYADALRQGRRVKVMLVETSGAISPRSLRSTVYPASARARGARARDSTKYGQSRSSTRSHTLHHTQRISRAAALGETRAILEEVRFEQQKLAQSSSAAERP